MKLRLASFTVVVAAAVLLSGGVCGRRLYPPQLIEVPNSVYAGDPAVVKLIASGRGYESVLYVVNWDDGVVDTSEPYTPDDVATMWHVWTAPDTMYVRAAVYSPDDPPGIRWAEQSRVFVDAGGTHAPVIDTVEGPPLAVSGVEYSFTVEVDDPDGDSIRVCIDWGDGQDTTSKFLHGPYYTGFYPVHTFMQVETATVVVTAQDQAGAISLPETVLVPVDTTGGVIWSYAPSWASPVIVNDGVEDCIYFRPFGGFDPGSSPFLALTQDGANKHATPPDSSPYGGAAYCAVTMHIIVRGSDLWAFDRQLHVAWRAEMPDSSGDLNWDGPAINGNRIYFGRGKDTLYCYIDSVDHGGRIPAFAAQGAIVDAPAIDANWAVYFGTDSGYLYKVGPWLDTTFWRVYLASYKIQSPVVGSAGTVFCVSDASRICSIDPATGTLLWTTTVLGVPRLLALGRTAIFVATGGGNAYSIDPATGVVNWSRHLTTEEGMSTAPVVAADGYVYFLSDYDVLYRVSQMDGALDWACDCGYSGGGYNVLYPGKQMPSTDYPPNSTMLPNGNIVVAGNYALYCVAGSREGPLDPLAPWPKWQHDLYNSGYVAGGR